jgi:hypothetical protein
MKELSSTHESFLALSAQEVAMLSNYSAELQVLLSILNGVCSHLSPQPPLETLLVDRLHVLPGHVECVVVEVEFHDSSIALRRVVSQFNKVNIAVITKGFAFGWSDEELDVIEDQVRPHAQSLASYVDVNTLVGAKAKTLPFAPAFVYLAAPTEAEQPARSTLRLLHYKTKTYDDVTPSHLLTRPGGPRGIRPIVTGRARRSVLRARFVIAFL